MSRTQRPRLPGWTRTIRGRLLAGLVVSMALGLVGSSVVTSALLDDYLQNRDERTLRQAIDRVRSSLSEGPQVVDADQTRALVGDPLGIVVVGRDGRPGLTFGSGTRNPAALLRATADAVPGSLVEYDAGDGDVSLLLARLPAPRLTVRRDDGRLVPASAVVLTMDSEVSDGAIARLVGYQIVVIVVTLALLALLGLLVLRFGLQPLWTMARSANAIASGARDTRLPTEGGGVETDHLARAVNGAFDAQARAENAVREFAADASHELRTPLTTISGWLDLHAQGGLEDRERLDHALHRVGDEVGRMRLLVEELSLLARLDAGRPLEREVVDLDALAGSVVEDANVVARTDQVRLVPAGDATVMGDALRLGQVLRNAVGNAVQHTPPGTPVIVRVTATGQRVMVEIADEGPGIPEADVDRVFERFWRADASRTRADGGSGLGMAIVAAIVAAHGGTAAVRSTVGAGTTVTIDLPRG
jgi:two-component system OmpR family sensor kinase